MCYSCQCRRPEQRDKERHLPRLGGHPEGVSKVSCNKPGMHRGPKQQPQLHVRPTKLKTHATRIQTPFQIRNHFKAPGFSALPLTIISLLISLFKYRLGMSFLQTFSPLSPTSGLTHWRSYLMDL